MAGGVDLTEELGTGVGHCSKHLVFSLQSLSCKDIEGNAMLVLPFQSIFLVEMWSALGWEAGA